MRIREYKSIFETEVLTYKRHAGEDVISASDYPSNTKFPVVYLNKNRPNDQLEAHKGRDGDIELVLFKKNPREYVFSAKTWEKVLKGTRTTRSGWRPVKK